ncbi:MAG: Nif3-like dinuclear metal center hexameric protein [Gemmataceae bacterium]
MATVGDIANFLQEFAPTQRAADWDNVGLLLGERSAPVWRALTCLTITPEVVAEAVGTGANLIVTHHPMLFRPTQKITDATAEGGMVLALMKAGIAVYSPHTAFDNCPDGINEQLAQKLELRDLTPLRPFEGVKQCKLIVFVPDMDLSRVSDAIFAAGAGRIGKYSECSFRLAGTGTFFGSDDTNPTVGQKGRREEVGEWRLEAVCPESAVEAVVAAMRKAHSYEEPALDVVPLRPVREPGGEGRLGRLAGPIALQELAQRVRQHLTSGPVQLVGDPSRPVERLALACGAAGEYLRDAVRLQADVFLTGEMRFHDYLSADAQQIALILPGHYATERFAVEILANILRKSFPTIAIEPSKEERNPVSWW